MPLGMGLILWNEWNLQISLSLSSLYLPKTLISNCFYYSNAFANLTPAKVKLGQIRLQKLSFRFIQVSN